MTYEVWFKNFEIHYQFLKRRQFNRHLSLLILRLIRLILILIYFLQTNFESICTILMLRLLIEGSFLFLILLLKGKKADLILI